jgi:CubicO group peptidase (beta-lactamase class C family)
MKRKIFVFIFMMTLCTFGFPVEKLSKGVLNDDTYTFQFKSPADNQRIPVLDRDAYEWPTSTPAAQGLDPYILSYANEKADELGFMYSVLVIRNGYLAAEQYFNGKNKYSVFNIMSASKSYIGALIGIALKENYLTSLDQKMLDFFPEYITQDLDPRKYDITIRHLLKFRAGYPYESSTYPGSDDLVRNVWRQNDDWMKFAIECPLAADPGETWAYSTPSSHILSGIITKATGKTALNFANPYLFDPLNINVARWSSDPLWYSRGGWGMYFTPRNMARLGYLYLNNGFVDGKQILPEEWVEESTKRYSEGIHWYQYFEEYGYGYLWWIAKAHGWDVYYAGGHGGQRIINIPGLNMIIVTTANPYVDGPQHVSQINSIHDLIENYILPAADGNHETTPYFPTGISGTRVENRSLLRTEYIDVLRWEPNPLNQGENISKYRIYYYTDESGAMTKVLLVEVNAGTTGYWCRNVPGDNNRTYGIASVTYDNRESVPAAITVQ